VVAKGSQTPHLLKQPPLQTPTPPGSLLQGGQTRKCWGVPGPPHQNQPSISAPLVGGPTLSKKKKY
jgi:hypothetical protein